MAQLFHPSANAIAKASIFGAVFVVLGALFVTAEIVRSSYWTEQNVAREQPVQFSHEHHVRGLGIDCRYCHTTVENNAFAGMPSTKVCMTCHSQIWTNAPLLEPVRASWREDTPIRWTRVHDLPDFVQFNHGIHVQKGIGCFSCHGDVSGMPLMWKANSLQMEWCLDCHRAPEKYIRPRSPARPGEEHPIYVMKDWLEAWGDRKVVAPELVKKYHVRTDVPTDPHHEKLPSPVTNCSVCHY
jgi:hypothetical protein